VSHFITTQNIKRRKRVQGRGGVNCCYNHKYFNKNQQVVKCLFKVKMTTNMMKTPPMTMVQFKYKPPYSYLIKWELKVFVYLTTKVTAEVPLHCFKPSLEYDLIRKPYKTFNSVSIANFYSTHCQSIYSSLIKS
jgi:hypothetical protein